MDYTRIRTKVEDGIETITLDYQQTLNAVDLTMALELEDALTKADKDEEVKVIVMEGAGRAFSAGGDIRYMKAHCEEPDFATKSMAALAGKLAEDIIHMKKLSKIIVCAVHGACAGGGMNLALGADYVICSDDAKFIQAFAGIALCPDTGAVFLLPRSSAPTAPSTSSFPAVRSRQTKLLLSALSKKSFQRRSWMKPSMPLPRN